MPTHAVALSSIFYGLQYQRILCVKNVIYCSVFLYVVVICQSIYLSIFVGLEGSDESKMCYCVLSLCFVEIN